MNIFATDDSPFTSALVLPDRHLPKMTLESCQMLAVAFRGWHMDNELRDLLKLNGTRTLLTGAFGGLGIGILNLLLENGEILNNNIYVCFAQDVLTNKVSDNLNDDYLLNVYFPLLAKNNVKSLSDLQTQRDVLLKNTETIMNEEI